jgi:hypothetical protein
VTPRAALVVEVHQDRAIAPIVEPGEARRQTPALAPGVTGGASLGRKRADVPVVLELHRRPLETTERRGRTEHDGLGREDTRGIRLGAAATGHEREPEPRDERLAESP